MRQQPLQIDYSVAGTWKNGFKGTITVTNVGRAPVRDWMVTFDFHDVVVEALDNAEIIAETERIYSVAPLPGAPALLPGGTASFGFTARGPAARLPVFIGDHDEDLEPEHDGQGVFSFVTGPRMPPPHVIPFPDPWTHDLWSHDPWTHDPMAGLDTATLASTDGLVLDDETPVHDLLHGIDWMYFENDAMTRVQALLGMGDSMPLPRPANENTSPSSSPAATRRQDVAAPRPPDALPPVPPRDDWFL